MSRAVWLVIAGVIGGCGSSGGHGSDGGLADVAHTADGTRDDAAQHDAPAPDAASTRHATLIIEETQDQSSSFALAEVVDGVDTSNTLVGVAGPCKQISHQTGVSHTYVSAGAITVTGLTSALTLSPQGTSPNVSYFSGLGTPPFTASATVTATADGAEYPAFSLSTTAPATVSGFSPPASISRAAGTTVTWTAGTGPLVRIEVAANGAGTVERLICTVPDSGSYTIAPAALALMPASVTTVSLRVFRYGRAVTSPDVELQVRTVAGAISPSIPLGS